MQPPPIVLSIAGYDPSSGAGITADIKTASSNGCYAVTCVTALTVQSSQGVFRVWPVDPIVISETLAALADDVEIKAVKIGMLGSGCIAEAVSGFLEARKLPGVVLDPVLKSSSGAALVDHSGLDLMRNQLLPLADVVTPNVAEASAITGLTAPVEGEEWRKALPRLRSLSASLHALGARSVVITGGHLAEANDYFSSRISGGTQEQVFPGHRIDSRSTHGTGCAFSMALACQLALGRGLPEAIPLAKEYVRRAIESAYVPGHGTGPLNHAV